MGLEPVWHKRSRPTPCDAATSTSQMSENLELEYASSLIAVMRSRKDRHAHAGSTSLSPPVEFSVPAAESITLLLGREKCILPPAEKLAPLVLHQRNSAHTTHYCDQDSYSLRAAATPQYTASKARRALSGAPGHGPFPFAEQRFAANRRQEVSILSKSRSPSGAVIFCHEMLNMGLLLLRNAYSQILQGMLGEQLPGARRQAFWILMYSR